MEELIWKRVHFEWYNKGCNWILQKIEWNKAICITPKTRKKFVWDINKMYPTKKNISLFCKEVLWIK
jgi:hypothetical protein